MLRIPLTPAPITIDGKLSDPAWRDAAVIPELIQADPMEGGKAGERTEVRLLYNKDYFYVGIRAFDSQPEHIVAKEVLRDAKLDGDDSIAIAIDPFHDRKHGYYFQINPLGTERDGLISGETNSSQGVLTYNPDWDGIWYAATAIDDQGWTAEIAIPTRTLSFDPANESWGFNIERKIARLNELDRWQGAVRNKPVFAMGEAGEINGLQGLDQGLGLDLVPFLKSKIVRSATGSASLDLKPGLDAFYKITPSVTASLTLNTDFAEAEVDQRQVNLTRFSLFFPEKRSFFLQDANFFQFGGLTTSPLPFFSRKIGLAPDGTPVDIIGGLKVTGKEGPLSFGLLDNETDAFGALPMKNLSVGRASLDIGKESAAGLIFTHGNPWGRGDNTLGGADFHYKNSDFNHSGQVAEANGYLMRSESGTQADQAFGLRLLYPNFDWNGALNFDQIGQGFDPALGFVDSTGNRIYEAWFGPQWREEGVDHLTLWPYVWWRTDLDGRLIEREMWLPEFHVETTGRDKITLAPVLHTEQYLEPFQLLPGVTVPTGRYTFWRYYFGLVSAPTRPVSAVISVIPGAYLDGERLDLRTEATWRPSSWFNVKGHYERHAVALREGAFTVHLGALYLNFALSPRTVWSTVAQWDNLSNSFGFNSRIRWTVEPGRDVFLVFNQGADTTDHRFTLGHSDLSLKIAWAFRF